MIGMDLSGQVAVVTGASGELGRVISRTLAKAASYPPRTAYLFDTEIPNSELHISANCGHAPHLEYPIETAQRIEQWLKKDR